MNEPMRKRLEAAGYAVEEDAGEWLGLTDEDRRVMALHQAVGRAVAARRAAAGLSQQALAGRIGSSQSRVTKVETGHPGVSLDLAFRCLFAAGGGLEDLPAAAPAAAPPAPAATPAKQPKKAAPKKAAAAAPKKAAPKKAAAASPVRRRAAAAK